MRVTLEKGATYLIKEKKPKTAFKIFLEILKRGSNGLCITRVHPKRLRRKHELGDVQILWITTTEISEEKCIHPSDLPKLNMAINEMIENEENAVILLEGIEYLITYNGFDLILRFIQVLNDRVMVTNSRLLIALDPATLDTGSLHIFERDLIPISVDEELEIVYEEDLGDEESMIMMAKKTIEKYRSEGFSVHELEDALKMGYDKFQKTLSDYEIKYNEAKLLLKELEDINRDVAPEDYDKVKNYIMSLEDIEAAEEKLLRLRIKVERIERMRKKEEMRRKQIISRIMKSIEEWKKEGFDVSSLENSITGDIEIAEEEYDKFKSMIDKAREIERELNEIYDEEFADEVEKIRSNLKNLENLSLIEDDVFRMKILIERKRREEAKKEEYEKKRVEEMKLKIDEWMNMGYNVENLHDKLDAKDVGEIMDDLRIKIEAIESFLKDEELVNEKYIKDLKDKILDISYDDVKDYLQKIKDEIESAEIDERKREFMEKMEEWKKEGYDVSPLLSIMDKDIDEISREFVVFKIRVHRLKELEEELNSLDYTGFEHEYEEIKSMIKNTESISEIERRIAELRVKIKMKIAKEVEEKKVLAERKKELISKVSQWINEGYKIENLEEIFEKGLDEIEEDVKNIQKKIEKSRKLKMILSDIMVKTENKDILEKCENTIEKLNDLSMLSEAEDDVKNLKEMIEREEVESIITEKVKEWKDWGVEIESLDLSGTSQEVIKKVLEYDENFKRIKEIYEDIEKMDIDEIHEDVENLRNMLKNLLFIDEIEEKYAELRDKYHEIISKREKKIEDELKLREEFVEKIISWAKEGYYVGFLEAIVDEDIEVLRDKIEECNVAINRLKDIEKILDDIEGHEVEKSEVKSFLKYPEKVNNAEEALKKLMRKIEEEEKEIVKTEEELERKKIKDHLDNLKKKGYVVDAVEMFINDELDILNLKYKEFLKNLKECRKLKRYLKKIDAPTEEIEKILSILKNPMLVKKARDEIDALKLKMDEIRKKREKLIEKVLKWETEGYDVSFLKKYFDDVDALSEHVEKFGAEIAKMEKLEEEIIILKEKLGIKPILAEKVEVSKTNAKEKAMDISREMRHELEEYRKILRGVKKKLKTERTIFGLTIVILLSLFIALGAINAFNMPRKGIRIDGDFQDWSDIQSVSDITGEAPSNLDIEKAALTEDNGKWYIYIKVQGLILKGMYNESANSYEYDIISIYIDKDGNPATGERIEDIGADCKISIVGYENEIKGVDYNVYEEKWKTVGIYGGGAVKGGEIEMELDLNILGIVSPDSCVILLKTENSAGEYDTLLMQER